MRIKVLEPKKKAHGGKLRVGAYGRVSTDTRKQEDSLENQVEYYERTIKARPDYQFVKVYMDQGISGTSENRPGFQEMLEDARNKKLDLILTKSISRFARNTVTVLKYARELKEYGVGIFFEEQNINTLSGEGELMLTVLASFAQEESRSVSENNKWSIQKKFQRGEAMITTERFMGYDKNKDGNLVINNEEAKIVRRIFELYLEGKGSFTIAKILNSEGIPTITGRMWQDSTITGMLVNEKYKGDLWLQKYYTPENMKNRTVKNNGAVDSYYIKDNHEAIVTESEWDRVQDIMEGRRKAKGMTPGETGKYQNRYPLSGLLLCPYCRKTLRRSQVYGGKIQWICSTYIKKGKATCPGIRVDDAEVNGRNITEPTIVEEDYYNGQKHYLYTSAKDYKEREWKAKIKEAESSSVLPRVNRPRRAAIKL